MKLFYVIRCSSTDRRGCLVEAHPLQSKRLPVIAGLLKAIPNVYAALLTLFREFFRYQGYPNQLISVSHQILVSIIFQICQSPIRSWYIREYRRSCVRYHVYRHRKSLCTASAPVNLQSCRATGEQSRNRRFSQEKVAVVVQLPGQHSRRCDILLVALTSPDNDRLSRCRLVV